MAMAMLLLLGLAVASAGCAKTEVTIETRAGTPGADFGRRDLLAAAATAAASPTSAAAYKVFADTVERLRPGFDQTVAQEAELRLVFLALGPLQAHEQLSPAERLALLATTVWPTALGVAALAGETPTSYLSRACQGALALQCKRVVPQEWGVVIGALAWRRINERAVAAYSDCERCGGEPAYASALAAMGRHHRAAGALAELRADRAHPNRWPSAGQHARDYAGAPVYTIGTQGSAELDGVPITSLGKADALRSATARGFVLAVHLPGSERVFSLRASMRDAAAAGFKEVALLVRHSAYPYELCAYHISVEKRRGVRVRVRDADSIQLLVQSLDNASVGSQEPLLRI